MHTGARLRGALAVLLVSILTTTVMLAPGPHGAAAGLSTDTLFWLRDTIFGPRRPGAASRVAVVLIDEATYATYKDMPKDFWSPYFGRVIDALNRADARVIGFDIVLPMSIGRFIPGYDKEFLGALKQARAADRLVMIRGQSGDTAIQPAREQLFVLGMDSVRSDAVLEDADGVVRRQPLMLKTTASPPGSELSFAAELARRAGWTPRDETLLLNFDGGEPFETWSLADLVACDKAGQSDFFPRHFKNRVVLIGTGLQFEDRVLTSRRFMNRPERFTGDRCLPVAVPEAVTVSRDTMPGVFIHATAIDNLLRHEALWDPPPIGRVILVSGAAALAATLGLFAGFVAGGTGLIALLAFLIVGGAVFFEHDISSPLIETVLAAILGYFLLLAYRLVITERNRRRIRQMFGLYLAPSVIAQLETLDRLPERGSERRRMTLFFSDIAGFTTLTEAADPTVLAPTLNEYFDGVCAAVEAEGGIVVEFLGDGVQALFGAPTDQPDHAARAVAAVRKIDKFAEQFRADGVAKDLGFGHTRLGVHTGDAMVGNIGASHRLKYAALGDVVNATSRLEGLNKYFGTRICISSETAEASGDPDVRPIGDFLVEGKFRPVRVYELMAAGSGANCRVSRYRTAFQLLSDGNSDALQLLTQLAEEQPDDQIVAFYLARARSGQLNTTIQMTKK
jgi:adenylate cyclase